MAAKKKIVDWEAIEQDWRAGIKSAIQMGVEHDISHTAINKHFRKLGVERDLTAKIRAKAEAMVSAAQVSGMVSEETTATTAEIINTNALTAAKALFRHQTGIKRSQQLYENLLAEIEAITNNPDLFSRLGELMIDPVGDTPTKGELDRVEKLRAAFEKVLTSPARIDSFKKLTDTLKTLIGLERQAYGLADNANGEADKPPAPPVSNEEAARRVAFMLLQASKGKAK